MSRGAQQIAPTARLWGLAINEEERRQRRLNSRLLEEEFEQFDAAAIAAAEERLVSIAALRDRNLIKNLAGIGVMKATSSKLDTFSAASQSMDGRSKEQQDAAEIDQDSIPVPVTFKDFEIGERELDASRRFGQALDTRSVTAATRAVAEKLEDTFFLGGDVTVGGDALQGATNFADRNTVAIGTNWDAETDLTLIIDDVLAMLQAAFDDNYFGPFDLFVPGNYSSTLEDDLKAESDRTVRDRIMAIRHIREVHDADRLTDDNVVLVQMTEDVVDLRVAMDIDVIDRGIPEDLVVKMKVWAVMAPFFHSDFAGNCGIVHLS